MSCKMREVVEDEQPLLPDTRPNVMVIDKDGVHFKWCFDDGEDIEITLKPEFITQKVPFPIEEEFRLLWG